MHYVRQKNTDYVPILSDNLIYGLPLVWGKKKNLLCFNHLRPWKWNRLISQIPKYESWTKDFSFDNVSVQKWQWFWPGDKVCLKTTTGSGLPRNVTVKLRRQPQRALSSCFAWDAQNCYEKISGYIFISLSSHDWIESIKLWRREHSVTQSAVLSCCESG